MGTAPTPLQPSSTNQVHALLAREGDGQWQWVGQRGKRAAGQSGCGAAGLRGQTGCRVAVMGNRTTGQQGCNHGQRNNVGNGATGRCYQGCSHGRYGCSHGRQGSRVAAMDNRVAAMGGTVAAMGDRAAGQRGCGYVHECGSHGPQGKWATGSQSWAVRFHPGPWISCPVTSG